jgi:hypothetical protein
MFRNCFGAGHSRVWIEPKRLPGACSAGCVGWVVAPQRPSAAFVADPDGLLKLVAVGDTGQD